MPIKDLTLEELIAKQQENKANRLAKNAENIAKISARAAAAEGAEKARLEALLGVHQAHKAQVEASDPVAIATERFNNIQERKLKPE